MINVITPKRISPDYPFKSNQRPSFFFWLRGVQFDSAVWCKPHQGAWLHGMMHTAERDSALWCTPWRLTSQYDAHCTPQSYLKIIISRRNRKRIRNYFSLFIAGTQLGSTHEKNRGKNSCDTLLRGSLGTLNFYLSLLGKIISLFKGSIELSLDILKPFQI